MVSTSKFSATACAICRSRAQPNWLGRRFSPRIWSPASTIKAFNIRYQPQLAFRRPDSHGDDRAGTQLIVKYDRDIGLGPHTAIIAP
jgi:hypothetical protein